MYLNGIVCFGTNEVLWCYSDFLSSPGRLNTCLSTAEIEPTTFLANASSKLLPTELVFILLTGSQLGYHAVLQLNIQVLCRAS